MIENCFEIINKKARFNYTLGKSYISGIILSGIEVKKIRDRKVNISDSFCIFNNNELFIKNVYIDSDNQDRKLLLRRQELSKLKDWLVLKGNAIIPTKVIVPKKGFIKIEICLAKGKKIFDKREMIKERDLKRYI